MDSRQQLRLRMGTLTLVYTLTFSIIGTIPAGAITSTAGDAGPNFTESGSCGTYGMRGPQATSTLLGSTEQVYGPFADFFGRNRTQVANSTSIWNTPSGHSYRVHNRTLPALQQVTANLNTSGNQYNVSTGAAWVWRTVAGVRQVSQHAFANGLDLNPSANPYRADGTLITNMPAWFIDAWEAAGFCWGGSWLTAKDPMHFTWRGPTATPGPDLRLIPFPPLNAAASYSTLAFDANVAVGSTGAAWGLAGRRRDGADDLYGVVPLDGFWQVQVAGAIHHFDRLGIRRTSTTPVGSGPVIMADHDLDGRADLWSFDTSGSTLTATVRYDSDRFVGRSTNITTGVTWSADAEIGLAPSDFIDWSPDLFVVRRWTGLVEVYSAASGFTEMITSGLTSLGPLTNEALVLADVDVDGRPDLLAISRTQAATIRVIKNSPSTGYTGPVETIQTNITVGEADVVMPGDWDGDGRPDIYVLSGNRLRIWLGGVPDRPLADLNRWFTPNQPVFFDAGPVCQSVCDQVGFVNQSGSWRFALKLEWGPPETSFFYGNPGDVPFLGDWDGDGVATPGLYRPSDGFAYLRHSNTEGVADLTFFFGNPGDVPVVGDWDGDGKDTLSLYRPSEARFYIINRLGEQGGGLGVADYSFIFGNPGDQPFAGDLDGNGIDEVALHRVSTGRVYYRLTLTEGVADADFIYGNPGDAVFAGDWDGNGTDTVGLYRPGDGNWYLRLANTEGIADHVIAFGLALPTPVRPFAGKSAISVGGLSELGCSDCIPIGS